MAKHGWNQENKKDNECIGEALGSKTKFKKKWKIKFQIWEKRVSFQFVPETANGKFRVAQVVRKRVPKCGRGMKEATGAIVFILVRGTI